MTRLFGYYNYYLPPNVSQIIDLDSNVTLEEVSQNFQINQTNQYLLSVYWLEPLNGRALGSSLAVKVNNISIGNITAVAPYTRLPYVEQYVITLVNGTNVVSFKMFGSVAEGTGYFLSNVTLQELIAFPDPTP